MAEQRAVRLALFGPGGFGQERARAMRESPLIEFAVCYSPFEAERQACQEQFGVRGVGSPEEIWNDPHLDGVVLSTPNPIHLEQTLQAAAAGKHVFVEKPIAPGVVAAQEMIAACAQAGVTLMVGHNSRRRVRIRTLKRLLDEGRLGRVLAAEANNSHAGGLQIGPGDWRWSAANCPGGPLSQLGIHKIDTLQYLLGPVARVSGWQRRLAVAAEIEDVTMTLLEFENGALGYIGAYYAVPHLRYVHLLGTQANARWDSQTGFHLEGDGEREEIPIVENDTVREEMDEFARCILTGASPEVDGQAALSALAVIEAAVLSNQRQRPVEIAELIQVRS